jgi:aspartyl-tRNA(Asn)/glutamyl-tRNA(Gln) amidotransferase subunit C
MDSRFRGNDASFCLRSDSRFPIPDSRFPTMSIDNPTVRRIAHLARLAVDDAQLPHLAMELGRVLELADQLAAADITNIEPMAHPHEQTLVWREDNVTETDRADEMLALAPEVRGGLYLVPKVIE